METKYESRVTSTFGACRVETSFKCMSQLMTNSRIALIMYAIAGTIRAIQRLIMSVIEP